MTVLVTDTIFIIISYIHNSVESIVLVNCQFLVFSIIEPTGNCIDMKQLSSTLSYPNRYICSLNDTEYTYIYIYIYIYIHTHTHNVYLSLNTNYENCYFEFHTWIVNVFAWYFLFFFLLRFQTKVIMWPHD